MNPFFFLLLAHLLLDYPLQGDFMATMKAKNNLILITHCALWSLGIGAVLTSFGLYASWQLWWLFSGTSPWITSSPAATSHGLSRGRGQTVAPRGRQIRSDSRCGSIRAGMSFS